MISNIILFIKIVFERKLNLNRGSESDIDIMSILISDTLKILPFFQKAILRHPKMSEPCI